jgi:hypothetical protein
MLEFKDTRWDIKAFYVFIIKKHSTKHKLPLPLFFTSHFFTSNLFTYLRTSHSNQLSMVTPHNNQLVVQNDSAHKNQMVGNVSVLVAFL